MSILIAELYSELEERFAQIELVSVINDRFENIPEYDCMVSAGNSFGSMDGGVDLEIVRYFGIDLLTSSSSPIESIDSN